MVDDSDGYRTAQALVRQYGADAPIRASMRHDELLERGDLRGAAVWNRVLAAIDALLMEKRPNKASLQ